MHWLCRIGIHRWDFCTEVEDGWVFDFHWCQRRGCRYEHPILVNRERSRILPPQEEDPLHAA